MKNFRNTRFVTCFWLIIFCINTYTQQKWGWEECAEYALTQNLDIKKQELLLEYQRLNVNGAKSAFLPSINGSSSFRQNYGRSIDPNSNDITNRENFANSYGIYGSINLFKGFARVNRLKLEKYNYLYAKARVDFQKNNTLFKIIEVYFNTLLYTGISEISNEQVKISQKELYKVKRMHELGRVSGSDIIELEAQLARDSLLAVQFEMKQILALNELKRAMNYPVNDSLILKKIEINSLLDIASDTNTDNVLSKAGSNLPQVEMLKCDLRASKKRISEIKGYRYPSLSMNSSWNSGYYQTEVDSLGKIMPFADQIKGHIQKNVGLSLSVPIFNKFSNSRSIQHAKLKYEITKTDYENGLIEIEYEIMNNLLELEAAKKGYLASVKNEEKQVMAFKTAEKKRDRGLIDIIDYSEVKNQYAHAKSEVLRAGIQLFIKYKTIQFYLTGRILE